MSTLDNTTVAAESAHSVELVIGGMTCASCAARIEKKLNKIDGVTATVNYATEKAKVDFTGAVAPEDLISTVEATGYTATLPAPKGSSGEVGTTDGVDARIQDEASQLRTRLLVSLALTVPVVALSMIPPLQFTNWQWLALTLASPVVVWGALPFHRAALTNARHGAATMDTLISVGVSAAYLWSLWALFFGHAGMAGHEDGVQPVPTAGGRSGPHLSGSRCCGHRLHTGGAIFRSPRQEAVGCSPTRTDGHGSQRRSGVEGTHRDPNFYRTIGGR